MQICDYNEKWQFDYAQILYILVLFLALCAFVSISDLSVVLEELT